MMIAVQDMLFTAAGYLNARPNRFPLEQSHQAPARIESELCQKLKAIAALSSPSGMDEVQWESAKAAMEAQAKKDAEEVKLSYKAVVQFSEQYKVYDSLTIDGETLPATPTENAVVGPDKQTSKIPEAEKKIAALLHQYSHKNASPELELSGLLLHSVPEAIQKLFSTLVKLDLSNNYLESLDESVTNLVNLTHLDLHSNQLRSLPHSIGRLVKLKALNVSGNALAALPDSIGSCSALEELMADFNQLTWLPEMLGFEVLNLRKLCVHSNKLMRLPYSICHMMCLRFLDIHMNKLGGLPEDLGNLMNLEYLDLSSNFNYLVALPESIGGLTSLVELNISYNQIIALPEAIGRLEKLQVLKLEGNPLVIPPIQVVDDGVEAIKEYMTERMKARYGGMRSRRQSCLGCMASAKWRTPSCYVARASPWEDYGYATDDGDVALSPRSPPPRRAFFSPRRLDTPRRSLSPLGAFATPRRTIIPCFKYKAI